MSSDIPPEFVSKFKNCYNFNDIPLTNYSQIDNNNKYL